MVESWDPGRHLALYEILRKMPRKASYQTSVGMVMEYASYVCGTFAHYECLIFYVFCVKMTSSVKLTHSLIRTVSCIKVLIVINATKNFN